MQDFFADWLGRALDVAELSFDAPWALYLIYAALPLCALALVRWRDLGLIRLALALLARAALVAALALALARPVEVTREGRASAVILIDSSPSLSRARLAAEHEQALALIGRAGKARLRVLGFAEAVEELQPETLTRQSPRRAAGRGTDIAAALRAAYPLLEPRGRRSVVLLSDGNQTRGSLLDEARRAAALGLTLYGALPGRPPIEVRVVDVKAPQSVRDGEELEVEAQLEARRRRKASVVLWRGEDQLASQQTVLQPGLNTVAFRTRAAGVGIQDFKVVVRAAGDPQRANDSFPARVQVEPRPRALVLGPEQAAAAPIATLISGEDLEVEPRGVEGLPSTLAELSEYDAVVLSNLSVSDLSEEASERLRRYVQELAGGLLWIGGARSKDLSKPEETPIERLLPLHFERRKRKEKLSLAMVLVIDRSGSMGREGKFQAALRAAEAAVDELKDEARIALVLFDDLPAVELDLTPAAERERIKALFHTLQIGGGTSIYPALAEAREILEPIDAKVRHVLLLSDGESVTRFEHHRGLVERFAQQGMTISTVALGPDADKPHLRKLASAGGGRYYYAPTPDRVPRIFTRETRTISETGAIEREVLARATRPSELLQGIDLGAAGPLTGVLSCKSRPTAELLAETSKSEPLLARWRYGLGQAIAWSSDAAGPWTEGWADWPDLSRLWQRLARAVLRRARVAGLSVEARSVGDAVEVTVVARDRAGRPLPAEALRLTVLGPDLEPRPLPLQQGGVSAHVARHSPGRPGAYLYRAERVEDGAALEAAVARLVEAYPDEFAAADDNAALLEAACRATGGRLDAPPEEIFAPGEPEEQRAPRWPPLVFLALGLLLVETAARRL